MFSSEILEVVQMVVGVPIPGRSPSVSPCFSLKILCGKPANLVFCLLCQRRSLFGRQARHLPEKRLCLRAAPGAC